MSASPLTPRQTEVLERLKEGLTARDIAKELGISRNAVYQQIQVLRKRGYLPTNFTPTGLPPREVGPLTPGANLLRELLENPDGDEETSAAAASMALAQLRNVRNRLNEIVQELNEFLPY